MISISLKFPIKNRLSRSQGNALISFAIVLPLLVIFIFYGLKYGIMTANKVSDEEGINNALRDFGDTNLGATTSSSSGPEIPSAPMGALNESGGYGLGQKADFSATYFPRVSAAFSSEDAHGKLATTIDKYIQLPDEDSYVMHTFSFFFNARYSDNSGSFENAQYETLVNQIKSGAIVSPLRCVLNGDAFPTSANNANGYSAGNVNLYARDLAAAEAKAACQQESKKYKPPVGGGSTVFVPCVEAADDANFAASLPSGYECKAVVLVRKSFFSGINLLGVDPGFGNNAKTVVAKVYLPINGLGNSPTIDTGAIGDTGTYSSSSSASGSSATSSTSTSSTSTTTSSGAD
ncbi:hypothetical protein JNK13_03695 [bacterium]|nr:hypothetical protein [bacterium]